MSGRLKLKFLVCIWGARYIEEFARISLPSYLAEGNLPVLAAETDLEIVVMTTETSVGVFDEEPALLRLRELCPIKFIFIDDIVTNGIYGVTLTLAFARGIRASGDEQTSTTFVFMNSDFVLADGALRAMLQRIRAGERCIMAPSLRAAAEEVLPALIAAVDPADHVMRMGAREMVSLAFRHLHPTVVAKTLTQQLVTCGTYNQVYWQVDQNTLLARYHLIFMLAITPEAPLERINSYCDYGFVPEMVPSGTFSILDDSDEFFMLELQPQQAEKNLLRGGSWEVGKIATELSYWTTEEHRRFGEVDVVFHTGDLPPTLPDARKRLGAVITRVVAKLRKPLDHVEHFYWEGGVQAWVGLKNRGNPEGQPPFLPPELQEQFKLAKEERERKASNPLGRISHVIRDNYTAALARARQQAARRPHTPLWHHLWQDNQLVLSWLHGVRSRPGGRNLFLCDETSGLGPFFERQADFDVRVGHGDLFHLPDVNEAIEDAGRTTPRGRYRHLLLHLYRSNIRTMRGSLETAAELVEPGGSLSVYVEHRGGELDPSNFSSELAAYIEQLLPANWLDYRITTRFVGGMVKRRVRRAERRIFHWLVPSSSRRIPLIALAALLWPVLAGASALRNILAKEPTDICPPYCSSFLVTLTSREPVTELTAPPGPV